MKNMSIVCAILVVSSHIGWAQDHSSLTWYVFTLVENGVSRIAVPFFFIASGLFLAAHFNDDRWWEHEVKKRLMSLVVPFFVWSVIYFLLTAPVSVVADLVSHRPFGTSLNLSDGQWLIIFGLNLNELPMLSPLWYVRCLFLFVLAAAFFKVCVYRLGLLWLVIAFVVSQVIAQLGATGKFLSHGFSLAGMFYFSLGIFLQLHKDVKISNKVATGMFLCAVCFALVWTWLRVSGKSRPIIIDMVEIPVWLYLVWYIMPAKKWPDWLTRYSFPIFLMHDIFIGYLCLIMRQVVGEKADFSVVIFLGAILGSWIAAMMIKKFMPRVAHLVFGGRI